MTVEAASWETLFRRAPGDVSEMTVREVLSDHRRSETADE